MLHFKPFKKQFALFLLMLIMAPSFGLAQDETPGLIDLDIPTGDQSYYTEDLWEITEEGIFDEKGEKVSSSENTPVPEISDKSDSTTENYQESLKESLNQKKGATQGQLSDVRAKLEEQRERYEAYTNKVNDAEEALAPLREEILQLQEQIDLINDQIEVTKEKITNVEVMVAEKQIQIKDSLMDLQKSEAEVSIQKEVVLEYIQLLYQEEDKFFDLYEKSSSSLKLLLSESTVAENLVGEQYIAIMEETGRDVFNDLNETRKELAEKQVKILKQQRDLQFLSLQLKAEKRTYDEAKAAKTKLLEDTQGEEEKYNLLLEESVKQQQEAALAVKSLALNASMIESALSSMASATPGISLDDLQLSPEVMELIEEGGAIAQKTGKPLSWPLPPNAITAQFRDPSYPAKWGYHNAIDIRAAQYTPILAPADGYVEAHDNGMGYSFIVLAHKGGLSTVFGHVSEIMVKTGTTVKRGEVIGLSGGTPGTKGAGLQTTGAHLHFEVHVNGTAVDPLDFLPISQMPPEYVPASHKDDLKTEQATLEQRHEQ